MAPIAVSPLQAWHTARGARFAVVDGWQVPLAYSSAVVEADAARTGLALADISFLHKLSVRHKAFVSALSGQARRGTVTCVGENKASWVCRLTEDHCLLLCASAPDDCRRLVQGFPAYRPELVFDVTSHYAGFALFGPDHGKVLRRLTSFDIDQIGVPGACAETGLAGVHAVLVRPPGLLAAVQVYVTWDLAEFVCERILEAAGPDAIVPLGMEALKALWSL
jgi:glycine cleavage system aminomethyltransferase T